MGKYTEQPAEGKTVLCTSQVLVNAKIISPHVKTFINICLSMTEAVKLIICGQKQDTVSYLANKLDDLPGVKTYLARWPTWCNNVNLLVWMSYPV